MAITPITGAVPPVATPPAAAATRTPQPGFGDAIAKGLSEVSGLEQAADAVTQSLASGGPAQIHDLMVATTKAQLGMELLTAVRNRAVEAYQEVMRLQV